MIKRIIKLVIAILYYNAVRVLHRMLRRHGRKNKNNVTLLTYHAVEGNKKKIFEKHVSEIIKVNRKRNVEYEDEYQNAIVVTFDDGYENIKQNALKLLNEKSIPSIVFLTTGYLGAYPEWIETSNKMQDKTYVENKSCKLLQPQEIDELKRQGNIIGSHTVTHKDLSKIPDDQLWEELLMSKNTLEILTKEKIEHLSLPYNKYSVNVFEKARAAGYLFIYLNVPFPQVKINNTYIRGRMNMTLNDWEIEYKYKIKGAYEWLGYVHYIKYYFMNVWHNHEKSISL